MKGPEGGNQIPLAHWLHYRGLVQVRTGVSRSNMIKNRAAATRSVIDTQQIFQLS
jgi:hypothetical protein